MKKTRYVSYRLDAVWDSLKNPNYFVMHPEVKTLKKLLCDHKPSIILDIGCGNKRFYQMIAQYSPNSNYWGFDVENNRIGTVDVIIEGSHNLPVKSNAIDLIICTNVLEHIEKPTETIKEFYRILRPEKGSVFLTAPLFEQEHEKPYDYFRYTQFGLKNLFEEAGFERNKIILKPWGGCSRYFCTSIYKFYRYDA